MKASSVSSDAFRAAAFLLAVFVGTLRMNGAFSPSSFARMDIPANGGQFALAVGDLDGDGRPDVVAGGASIGVYRNVGTAGAVSFAPRVEFATGNPVQMRLADVDGDGRLDIVAANQNYSISLLRNTSTAGVISSNSFAAPVTLNTPGEVTGVAVADLNGDGKADLAVSCYNPGVFCLFQNNSTSGVLSFGTLIDMNTGYGVANVEAGDLDGDGGADLVISLTSPPALYIYRNLQVQDVLARSSFAVLAWFPCGRGASVTLADIDGDGKLDLVTANPIDNTLSLWRNTATLGTIDSSSLAQPISFTTGAYPYRAAIGDLDGDGRMDIFTANSLADTISVFQNLSIPGSLALAPRVDYPTGRNPRISAAADFNADGLPDLALANILDSFVCVFRQLPPPSPPPRPQITTNPVSLSVPVGAPATFTVTAAGTGLSYHWLFQGMAIPATSSLLTITNVTPSDGGAYAAIVSNDGGSVTSKVATLNVILPAAPQITTNPASQTVELGASPVFNVSATGTNLGYQWYFQGSPRSGATSATLSIRNAMFDDAGSYFVTVTNLGGGVTSAVATLTVSFDSNSVYEPHVDIPASTINPGIAFGDLDGDGKPEAVVANYVFHVGGVSVYRNLSVAGHLDTNSFAPFVSYPVGAEPVQTLLADLDGDGKLDIVCVCQNGQELSVFRNTTTPGIIDSNSFAPRIALPAADRPTWAAIADLNGDGKLDLMYVTYYGARVLSAFANTSTPGTISFAQRAFITPNADSFSVEAGDIDGDGRPDIVVCSASTPVVWVFRNQHTGGSLMDASFAARVSLPAGDAASVKLADMDGDGKLDIVLASASENTTSVLRNTSTPGVIDTNSFAAKMDFPAGLYPYRPAIADLNGDSRPDIAVANAAGDSVSVFLNAASPGSFTAASLAPRKDYPTGLGPRVVAVADIDGDGQADLATADFSETAFSVLRHAGPHPAVLRSPVLSADGLFKFEFDVQVRTNYTIDASIDLLQWSALTNFLDASGLIQFKDPVAPTFPGRFYRVRSGTR